MEDFTFAATRLFNTENIIIITIRRRIVIIIITVAYLKRKHLGTTRREENVGFSKKYNIFLLRLILGGIRYIGVSVFKLINSDVFLFFFK